MASVVKKKAQKLTKAAKKTGKAAASIPTFKKALPWQKLKREFTPTLRESAAAQVTPELARTYGKEKSGFLSNLARTGGGRFGAGWGGLGTLGAATQRERTQQMQDWVNSYMSDLENWYNMTGEAYNRARTQGKKYKLPKQQNVLKSAGITTATSPFDWRTSPFIGLGQQYYIPGGYNNLIGQYT